MSEKAMWNWLKRKMANTDGWEGKRLEGCNAAGVPDAVCRFNNISTFVELKDWSGPKRHPLGVNQINFLRTFGGFVMIKVDADTLVMVGHNKNLLLLSSGNVEYAMSVGLYFFTKSFVPDDFNNRMQDETIRCNRCYKDSQHG